jgi:hypothetical protein
MQNDDYYFVTSIIEEPARGGADSAYFIYMEREKGSKNEKLYTALQEFLNL